MGRGRGQVIVRSGRGRGRGRSGGTTGSGMERSGYHITATGNTPNSIKEFEKANTPTDPGEQQKVTPFSKKLEQADVPERDPNDPNLSEYDRLSNLVKICHFNQTEFIMTLPPNDPEIDQIKAQNVFPCFCSNFLWPGLKPKFPDFPKGRNPFDLLPIVRDGLYPFDSYGRMLFDKATFDRWRANPKSADLLELQIKKLVQMNVLAGRWEQCFVPSEFSNYGSLGEWKFGRDSPDPPKPVEREPAEPDSGFVDGDFVRNDPMSGDLNSRFIDEKRKIEKWAPGSGNGYVVIDDQKVQFGLIYLDLINL